MLPPEMEEELKRAVERVAQGVVEEPCLTPEEVADLERAFDRALEERAQFRAPPHGERPLP